LHVDIHEVDLKDKPAAMLNISPKGTVPVLLLPDGQVIDESLDIMDWALTQSELFEGLKAEPSSLMICVQNHDTHFKHWLDRYKYAVRYPEQSMIFYRQQAEVFLHQYEQLLQQQPYLAGTNISWLDMAIMPFVRQFAYVDEAWFYAAPYPKLQQWLVQQLHSVLFQAVMKKEPKR